MGALLDFTLFVVAPIVVSGFAVVLVGRGGAGCFTWFCLYLGIS